MKQKTYYRLTTILAFFITTFFLSSCTSQWPQFRGPEDNMVATGKNLPTEWGKNKNTRWVYELSGTGWSSPIVWGNKIFITTSVLEKKAPVPVVDSSAVVVSPKVQGNTDDDDDDDDGENQPHPQVPAGDKSFMNDVYRLELTCIDLKTGKELWKQVAYNGNPRVKTHAGNGYASETPVTDGKRIYAYFGMTGLYCYDMNGKLLWQKDLGAYNTQRNWGTGSSPVIYNDILYVQIDNEDNSFIVALDAKTGDEKWKAAREEKTNYSTPVIWKNKVRAELVTAGKTARSYDPATGKLLWQLTLGGNQSISSPIADTEHIYLGNSGEREIIGTLFSVKAGAEGDITPKAGELTSKGVEWSVPNAGVASPSPLLYKNLIYITGGRGGEVSCFNATTGKLVYKEKLGKVGACWASPWAYEDKIYFFDEKGITNVIKAGEKFEVLSQNTLDDKFWASIAITSDAYIFKGEKRLYCVKNL